MPTLPPPDQLRTIVERAVRAPSIHNTQPWRFVAHDDRLELWAAETWQLVETDPLQRDMAISCGAVLQQLRIVARAAGWDTVVRHVPDPYQDLLMATIAFRPAVPAEPSDDELDLAAAAARRRTDRRPMSSWPVPEQLVEALRTDAQEHGVFASPGYDDGAAVRLFRSVLDADRSQRASDGYVEELLAWSADRSTAGVPAANRLTGEGRHDSGGLDRFPSGTLRSDPTEGDSGAVWMVLSTSSDDRLSWLRTGEALLAMWLRCTVGNLALVPYSQSIEVDETRRRLREDVLDDVSCPQLIVKVGWPGSSEPVPATPRRSVEMVLTQE